MNMEVEVEVEEINNHMEDYIACACYRTSWGDLILAHFSREGSIVLIKKEIRSIILTLTLLMFTSALTTHNCTRVLPEVPR